MFTQSRSLLFTLIAAGIMAGQVDAQPQPISPIPTQQQKDWQSLETIAFLHFGINTFTGREWGDGTEDPALFNPTEFDAAQWARVLKESGMKLAILTAKHHDGFCLWPSQYTDHTVANSPWRDGQGDVVKEFIEACRAEGLEVGLYLSPWDRHEPTYGDSPKYNQFFKNQLRELLTQYGKIDEVWFDGAMGEGPNGKRQVYDWAGYYALIRELQPEAVIAIMGPDVRWVGNESGVARETEWSVQIVPPGQEEHPRYTMNPTQVEGSFEHLAQAQNDDRESGPLVWYPAESDVSIRPGWFYHPEEDDQVKTLEHLLDIYYQSVGRNSVLLLNIPPDPRGLIHENDVERLQDWREVIDATFDDNLAENAEVSASSVWPQDPQNSAGNLVDGDPDTYWAPSANDRFPALVVTLPQKSAFDVIELQEPIDYGQRIAGFAVDAMVEGSWKEIATGTTIGYKRLLRLPYTVSDQIRIRFLEWRATPMLSRVALFERPPVVRIEAADDLFLTELPVRLESDTPGAKIHYTIDGRDPGPTDTRFIGTFKLVHSATVRAYALGGVQIAERPFTKVVPYEPVLAANPFPGLAYEYYEGGWQSLVDLPAREPAARGTVEGITLEPRQQDQHFALQFKGFITVPERGIYRFYLTSDDGSRLWIHDDLVVDHDGLHGMVEKRGSVALQAGMHPFRLAYFNAAGDFGLRLEYEGPGVPRQAVPSSVFHHVNVPSVDGE